MKSAKCYNILLLFYQPNNILRKIYRKLSAYLYSNELNTLYLMDA